eukprot:GHVO01065615.1.p1 GENE.GHVO01065615.1~~GHVO01065615.1.p1  ORF type:complete len:139 (-),score=29.71 GHVO01065615.1:43-426(-)
MEAAGSIEKAISIADSIVANGMHAGLSIKPKTSLESVLEVLDTGKISTLLIMTVEPGWGGQSFMTDMMTKVQTARGKYPDMNIQVDGGLNVETAETSRKSGANVIVAGTSIFSSADPSGTISKMRGE